MSNIKEVRYKTRRHVSVDLLARVLSPSCASPSPCHGYATTRNTANHDNHDQDGSGAPLGDPSGHRSFATTGSLSIQPGATVLLRISSCLTEMLGDISKQKANKSWRLKEPVVFLFMLQTNFSVRNDQF